MWYSLGEVSKVAKIYVGNLPFGREGATATPGQPVTRKYFSGQLNEGAPSSVFPRHIRQQLDSGEEVALYNDGGPPKDNDFG